MIQYYALPVSLGLHASLFLILGSAVFFSGKSSVPQVRVGEFVLQIEDVEQDNGLFAEEPPSYVEIESEEALLLSIEEEQLSEVTSQIEPPRPSSFILHSKKKAFRNLKFSSPTVPQLNVSATQNIYAKQFKHVGSQSLFGMEVSGDAKVGLVVDISPSMEVAVARVLKEVYRIFPNSMTVTIDTGAIRIAGGRKYSHQLVENRFNRPIRLQDLPHASPLTMNTALFYAGNQVSHQFTFLDGVGQLMKSGASVIYWVTDFRDTMEPESLAYLQSWLLEKKVKFYVHSVEKPVPDVVDSLVQISGGQGILKPLK